MLVEVDVIPMGLLWFINKDAEGIDVGTGRLNTNAIVSACDEKETAAQVVLIAT